MNREEAERQSKKLTQEHPERDSYRWLPTRGGDGEWTVVKMHLPRSLRRDPMRATAEAKPKPPQADDPRPPMFRDVGGPYAAG
jgi:hypothetical protein